MSKTKKKRLPIQQLRETALEAELILRDRGIHTKESAIDAIVKEGKILLPGRQPYLPHLWSLKASRKVLGNILILWINETKNEPARREDHKAFFNFMLAELFEIEKKEKSQVESMPAILKALKGTMTLNEIFAPMQAMETTHTMSEFMVDAFAVAVILKELDTVSDFVFWFDEWTTEMEKFWGDKEKLDG